MALVQMWPPANGALNSISFNSRTYTSVPGSPAQVQDFDVPVMQANGWTTYPTAPGQNYVPMTAPASATMNTRTFNGRSYRAAPGQVLNVPLFDAGILQANGWVSISGIPVNAAGPSISGTAQVGRTLTASTGAWSNSPASYSYSWIYPGGSSVAGVPSGNSYVPVIADVGQQIVVAVTATNAAGTSAPASSTPTSTVTAGVGSPSLSFSITSNSQYVPALVA